MTSLVKLGQNMPDGLLARMYRLAAQSRVRKHLRPHLGFSSEKGRLWLLPSSLALAGCQVDDSFALGQESTSRHLLISADGSTWTPNFRQAAFGGNEAKPSVTPFGDKA